MEPTSKKTNRKSMTATHKIVQMIAHKRPEVYIFFNENFGIKYTSIYPVYISFMI